MIGATLRALCVGLAIFVLLPEQAVAKGDAGTRKKKPLVFVKRSTHYTILVRRRDVKGLDPRGIIDKTTVREYATRCLTIFESVRKKMTSGRDGLGFRKPARTMGLAALQQHTGRTPVSNRTYVIIEPLGTMRAKGFVRRADRMIRINLTWLMKGDRLLDPEVCELAWRLLFAHEVFHTIQLAYDPREASWLMESTATWMEYQFISLERNWDKDMKEYLHYPWIALDYAPPKHRGKPGPLNPHSRYGRPYGTGIFFQYLERQHPAGKDVVRQVWEACAGNETNARMALARFLGGEDALRRHMERFAIGCLLDDEAPPDCVHAGTPQRGHRGGRAEYELVPGFTDHMGDSFRDPDTAALHLDFKDAVARSRGTVQVMGTRYLALPRSPDLPVGTEGFVAVKAARDELTLQGVYHDGTAWSVLRSPGHVLYEEASGSYLLRIPNMDRTERVVLLALTRHGPKDEGQRLIAETDAVFPMRVGLVAVPALLEVRIEQGGKTIHRTRWSSEGPLAVEREKTVKPNDEIDPTAGDADVHLVFSAPCAPTDAGLLLQVGGKHVTLVRGKDERTWSGKIAAGILPSGRRSVSLAVTGRHAMSATKAVLPLDQDPTTIAILGFNGWRGYERKGKGTAVDVLVRMAKLPDTGPPVSDKGKRIYHPTAQIPADPLVRMDVKPQLVRESFRTGVLSSLYFIDLPGVEKMKKLFLEGDYDTELINAPLQKLLDKYTNDNRPEHNGLIRIYQDHAGSKITVGRDVRYLYHMGTTPLGASRMPSLSPGTHTAHVVTVTAGGTRLDFKLPFVVDQNHEKVRSKLAYHQGVVAKGQVKIDASRARLRGAPESEKKERAREHLRNLDRLYIQTFMNVGDADEVMDLAQETTATGRLVLAEPTELADRELFLKHAELAALAYRVVGDEDSLPRLLELAAEADTQAGYFESSGSPNHQVINHISQIHSNVTHAAFTLRNDLLLARAHYLKKRAWRKRLMGPDWEPPAIWRDPNSMPNRMFEFEPPR